VFDVVSISQPCPNRGRSLLVRVYVEARLGREPVGLDAGACAAAGAACAGTVDITIASASPPASGGSERHQNRDKNARERQTGE
jgi:hypothetical protein